jgi:acyl-CoA dehydrogenase
MSFHSHLDWPFFEEQHRRFGETLSLWAEREHRQYVDHSDVDASCRNLVRALGKAGWLKAVVPRAYGGQSDDLDVRTLCIARQTLAWHDGLADFAFAMQGLGTASVTLFGTHNTKRKYLPPVAEGRHIAAFALSEPEAGSDVAALATAATQDGPAHVRIDGTKTWISNGGIADHYVVFARTGEGPGTRGLSSFVVDADAPIQWLPRPHRKSARRTGRGL